MSRGIRFFITVASLSAATLCGAKSAFALGEDEFDALREKVQKSPEAATEEDVARLLRAGKRLGRPHPVALAMKAYFSENLNPAPSLLPMAAENARLAGEFRTAAARYKSYLRTAEPSKEASRIAGEMYVILVDFLGARDDAYQFMRKYGDAQRLSIEARKFDTWFLEEAKKRKDYQAFASRLAGILADELPLEEERLHFWPQLDWLMREISHGSDNQFSSLPPLKKLVPLVRGDKRRLARYWFYVANLGFKAARAGKDKAALDSLGPDFMQRLLAGKVAPSETHDGPEDPEYAEEEMLAGMNRAEDIDDETAEELERKRREIIDRVKREEAEEQDDAD